ncbi:CHAT domain-containing protein [Micromonospora ureilytica]|uniref:Tetratricopeptide (TPR) repeat protein n=1 Tax=Micromonospora ureilytica TaxID=709868 RepID=A0ABS0JDL0_9ACTN|nr:CHAT domain-containing protein [Micromonospora ureilytica]MBG6065019.1 tetratricopeptide (TPR) repeat protein [Micromonospora ureilytica]
MRRPLPPQTRSADAAFQARYAWRPPILVDADASLPRLGCLFAMVIHKADRIKAGSAASSAAGRQELADLAARALALRQHQPREAIVLAEEVLVGCGRTGFAQERSVAERALGLAHKEMNDLVAAERHLRRAVAAGRRSGSPQILAMAQMSLGYVLAAAGRTAAAYHAVSAALPQLSGAEAGQALMQRGVVQHFRGRYAEAAVDYGAAIDVARREGDRLVEARARNNRAVLPIGDHVLSGEADLERAAELFGELGLDLAAADCRWNVGHLAARCGDLARALEIFADTERQYRRLDVPRPGLLLDRFELLAAVPLIGEAAAMAEFAVAELHHRGLDSDLAEALLARARAELLAGDPQRAAGSAAAAYRRFRRQHRPVWYAFARHIELRARFAQGTRTPAQLRALSDSAATLASAGLTGLALTAWHEAATVAFAVNRPSQARTLLALAARHRRGGLAAERAQGWHAQARLHRLDGDDRAAMSTLQRGLSVLDEYRVTLGTSELRARSSAHGQELAREGLELAIATGAPARVLAWAERWRASTLRIQPVSPSTDPELTAALARLRVAARDAEDVALAGGSQLAAMLRQQSALEANVRDLARRSQGAGTGDGTPVCVPDIAAITAQLGPAVLVELLSHGDRIWAVLVRDGRASLHDLCALPAVLKHQGRIRFALRRLVTLGASAGASAALEHSAGLVDADLFGPIRRRLGDLPLVIVPGQALYALPWAALPSCVGRPVTIAPSAATWLAATQRSAPGGRPVLVAGPRLPDALSEVAALAALWPEATALVGEQATVDTVTAALSGARLAHIATHGTFRADNPLFSTLELADGPLFAYELERLSTAPGCVIASACESGRAEATLGDELMGFVSALLASGTRTLVAALLPVPADRTVALMTELHRRLRAGTPAAPALAEAQQVLRATGDPVDLATAAAFVCLGAG